MKRLDVSSKPAASTYENAQQGDQYHSVEFSIKGLQFSYQFKLWNMASMSMCFLVKENSPVLPRLKVGDTLDMKFYSGALSCPTDSLKTTIRHITKNDEGRFKGHYLVALEILGGPYQEKMH